MAFNRSSARKGHGHWSLLLPLYIFTLLFVLFPIIYMIFVSLQTRAEVWGFVNTATLDNYVKLAEPHYLGIFLESLKLALLSTVIILLLGYPFGYLMARLSAKWKKRIMTLIMIPFWTSSLIRLTGWVIVFRANGLLDSVIMGLGLTSEPLKLLYSYEAVVFGMVYELLPFMILAVYNSAEKMDWTLVDAARDLGAGRFRAFLTITLQMTMPGILSGVVLTFIPSMGLFYIADVLGGNKIVLVGNVIQEQLTKGRNIPFAAAMSVVLMVMTTLLLALYKKITKTGEVEGIL